MVVFNLTLTERNVRQLLNKHPILIKIAQLKDAGKHMLDLHPLNHAKLATAKRMNKGAKIALSDQELETNAAGLMDILRSIGRTVKKGIDSTVYQKAIKPVVRQAVDTAVSMAPGIAQPLIKAGVDKVGTATNAFGLPKPRAKRVSKKAMGGSFLIA